MVRTSPPELEVLLRCARQRLSPASASRIAALCQSPAFGWRDLASAARHHQIAPLVLVHLLAIGDAASRMPPNVLAGWQQVKMKNVLRKMRQAAEARRVVSFFAARGTRVALLKGAALDAVLYDQPWYIQSADADLLVDKTWDALDEASRESFRSLRRGSATDIDFMRHHDLDMNRVLEIDYPRIWAEAKSLPYGGGVSVFVMSAEDRLLSACINVCRKRYRLLKGLMAIRECTLAREGLDWERFVRIARAAGANRLAWASLNAADYALGCDVPAQAMQALGGLDVRGRVLRAMSRAVTAEMLRIPVPRRESQSSRLRSELLRLLTYPPTRLPREFRARRDIRAFRRRIEAGHREGLAGGHKQS